MFIGGWRGSDSSTKGAYEHCLRSQGAIEQLQLQLGALQDRFSHLGSFSKHYPDITDPEFVRRWDTMSAWLSAFKMLNSTRPSDATCHTGTVGSMVTYFGMQPFVTAVKLWRKNSASKSQPAENTLLVRRINRHGK